MTAPGSVGQADRYRLDSRLATGGMGEVWRGTDTVLGREVAVKLLKSEYADDPTFRSRFEAEARNAAALHHPGVASVFDFGAGPDLEGSESARPFLVMELVPGQPLSALLRGDEPMPPEVAADLIAQAADAISAAHALEIVHRDVKPANMLITPDRQVKITDFGIARAADGVALTATGEVIGTPHYISPEQAEGKPATKTSDVYSLGVVLYECLAGHRPFQGDTPVATALAHLREPVPPLPESVPVHLREVTTRAMAKDPAQRFDSAADLAAALRGQTVPAAAGVPGAVPAGAVAAGAAGGPDDTRVLGATAAPAGAAASTSRRRGLPPWWTVAAAAVAILLVVAVISALTGEQDTGRTANPGSANGTDGTESQRDPGQRADPDPESDPGSDPDSDPGAPEPDPGPAPDPPPAEDPPPEPPPEEPEPEDDRIPVDSGDFVGMDKDDAAEELEGLGFEVEESDVEARSEDDEEDTVASVSPDGLVDPGSVITLGVFEEFEEPDDGDSDDASDQTENSDARGANNSRAKGVRQL